ncbi:MAG: carbon-nitrogen family hydrolase [Methanococcaceae archaeon]
MKIGLVQYDPVWESKEANKDKLSKLLARGAQTDILIFPEMTLTGFSMKGALLAEETDGKSCAFFSALAIEKKSYLVFGMIEQSGEKVFNSLFCMNKTGQIIARYRKIHPFTYSGESINYQKGSEPALVEIEGWKIGLSICYDLRFPELYRLYGKQKADLLINIANWPVPRISHWRTLLKARAIENQCFVAGVNRTGSDPKNQYSGLSSFISPMGEVINSSENEEKIIFCEAAKSEIDEFRRKMPFLDDIRLI